MLYQKVRVLLEKLLHVLFARRVIQHGTQGLNVTFFYCVPQREKLTKRIFSTRLRVGLSYGHDFHWQPRLMVVYRFYDDQDVVRNVLERSTAINS